MTPRSQIVCFASLTLSALCPAQDPSHASRAAAVIDSMPRIQSIQQAAISPDGRSVADVVRGELSVISLDNHTTHAIEVEGKPALRRVVWSPDSKQVAFLADLSFHTRWARRLFPPELIQAKAEEAEQLLRLLLPEPDSATGD